MIRLKDIVLAIAALSAPVSAANAGDTTPVFTISLRDTADFWENAAGGIRTGTAVLNKLQLAGSFQGDQLGMNGLTVHLQLFRTDGSSLSAKVGDIQTIDSIDAQPVTRLFESWIEKKFGDEDRSLAFRFGLMDLNSDYDSIQTSSLFVNSSQGIAAGIARSGRNGPSIYPISALGFRISWLPNKTWTFRMAAFDGVPGDLEAPNAFVRVKLDRENGALLIGQIDYHLSDRAKIEGGAWRYTTLVPGLEQVSQMVADQGAYISIEGPLPHVSQWSGWLRVGVANGAAQQVDAYWGGGVVGQGPIAGRKDDRIGFAIARAVNSRRVQPAKGLRDAETTYEASYQFKVKDTLALQPDVQYVVHPSVGPHLPSAFVVGLRIVLTAGYPRKAPATEATDPTVPPDGVQPTDDNGSASKSVP